MSLQTLPYLLVYTAAFIVSILVFYFSWKNRTAPGVRAFAVAVLLEISWLFGYVFEVNAATLQAKIFWDNFQYIGSLYAPIALLIFSLSFVGWKINVRRIAIALSILPSLVLIAIFTNTGSELIRFNTQIVPGIPYDELNYDFGLITNIGNYFLYAVSLAYIIILFTGFRREEKSFRAQLRLVLLGTGIPIIGLILGQLLGLKFANQRDTSPLLFVVSNAVIAFGIFRFHLFNILPIAREALFETIEDALIILNTEDYIVDANSPARKLLSSSNQDIIGMPIDKLIPDLYKQFGDVQEIRTEIPGANDTIYDLRITPLYDRSSRFIGRLVNAHDITAQKKTENEIQATSERNQRRAAQFQAIAIVANSTTNLQRQEHSLTKIAQTISTQLGHYHVGIFLLDASKQYAILRAANSTGGQQMLDRSHRLKVGEVGIVGEVAATGKSRIALDTGTDAVYFDNPDLPDTKSEVALPLMFRNEVIGVLDVQSTAQNAFSQDDIYTLEILANQVSIIIQNTRLYEENITALQNAEKAYRQVSGGAWKDMLKLQPLKGYEYDGVSSQPLTRIKSGHSISIPVNIRGENIGALKLEALDQNREWSKDEIDLITATAERAALALENARLLEDAQRRASREQVIGEISSAVNSSTGMEEILRNAVQELGQRIGGAEVVLELGTDLNTGE